jgi:tRNA modification GTPase
MQQNDKLEIYLSAKTQAGLALLTQQLKSIAGFENQTETNFTARRRHIDALNQAKAALDCATQQLQIYHAGELVAEELQQAQQHLATITGKFSNDDLLGEIFSSFCIGK